jgi:hypothetical protein
MRMEWIADCSGWLGSVTSTAGRSFDKFRLDIHRVTTSANERHSDPGYLELKEHRFALNTPNFESVTDQRFKQLSGVSWGLLPDGRRNGNNSHD